MASKVRHLKGKQLRFQRCLARVLVELRTKSGLSQIELSAKLGIGQGTLSQRESGATVFPADELVLYTQALGILPSTIIRRAEVYTGLSQREKSDGR